MKYDSIIVGGGIAGLTSAAYLSRAGKSVILFERQSEVGGLVQTFSRNGVWFDAGLRSIENSGIVFPMLRQLGIEIDFVKSNVSIGIGNSILKLEDSGSLLQYENFLKEHYPENKRDIEKIIREIRKIMNYMDVLYGLDNPAFMNMMEDRKYLFKVVLPWVFKFLFTVRKISALKEPVEDYLSRLTNNRALIDIIAQHFFQKTPTSFALSYFRLYLDYHYPKGGTATLIKKMAEYIQAHGGVIQIKSTVESLHPEEKYVIDNLGNRVEYDHLVWAADTKLLYNCIPTDELKDLKLSERIKARRSVLKDMRGGDSVYTVYLTVDEKKEYFAEVCTGHFFYTPDKSGLTALSKDRINAFLNDPECHPEDTAMKNQVKEYLFDYCRLNTFEIAIPVLRDETLAPEGKTGLIVSLLYDYQLAKKIDDCGWTDEIKDFLELSFIRVLDESIFPGLSGKVSGRFSSSPLTIERLTGNTDGGITGWAFTNPFIPAETRLLNVASSVDTLIPSVYQAGQWVYSPAGLPISILTGKLAADKALKS